MGGKEWGQRDYLLVLAYQLYLDSTCGHCGNSVYVCHNDANQGLYEVQASQCYPRAATDERKAAKGYKPEPGEVLYAVPIDVDLIAGSGFVFAPDSDADQKRDESGEGN